MSLTSPVTGGAQTGFTSPSYTLSADVAPGLNGVQYAVTGLGGTQVGVATHSANRPFTITWEKPLTYKRQGIANPVTGVVSLIPMNTHKVRVRRGIACDANLTSSDRIANATLTIDVPSGSEFVAPQEIRAMLSLMIGALTQISAGLGTTVVSNVFS